MKTNKVGAKVGKTAKLVYIRQITLKWFNISIVQCFVMSVRNIILEVQ